MRTIDKTMEPFQTPIIMAQLEDTATGVLIDKSYITKILYSASEIFPGEVEVPVTGHTNVEISTDNYLAQPIKTSLWTNDETGYNFLWTPDCSVYPLFPSPGIFRISITFTMAERNPYTIHLFYEVR